MRVKQKQGCNCKDFFTSAYKKKCIPRITEFQFIYLTKTKLKKTLNLIFSVKVN